MSVIGDAFVAIHPESAGFATTLQKQLSGINLGGTGAIIGASAVAGVVVGLAKIGQAFGSSRVQIQRETGATGDALNKTFDTVKNTLRQVPDSIKVVTDAVDELRRRGVPLGATFDTLAKQELDLARITKSDLASNVETTTAIFSKFNVPLREQPAALDAIFKGYQQSGKGLTDLTSALLSGGASFTQFGFGISDATALIAGLEKAGVNVQPALAGLRKAFGTIAKEGGDPKKVLADLIGEFTDGTPKAVALSDAIKLFGTRSGVELATAIQQGKFNVKDMLKIITDGKGGIEATSLATRTFGEELGILKNQVLVDLQPLGSQVWTTLRAAIVSATDPVGALVSALARLGQALSPLLSAIGVLVAVGFGALLGVVKLVAVGLDTVASVLEHIPGPVLIVAGAVAILAKALLSLAELGALASVEDAIAGAALGVESLLNPITLVIGALALIGAAMVIFGSKTSAASKEAKELSKTLFDTADSGHLFASGITNAAQGLTTFLTKQDAAGKIKDLDKALEGTTTTLSDVSKAVTGNEQDFESLKHSLTDTSSLTNLQKSLINMGDAYLRTHGVSNGLTQDQVDQLIRIKDTSKALDTQRDAFIKSSDAQIQLVAHTSPANAALAAQAEAIAHATTGTRGYGAALDFLNEALTEQAAKTDQAKLASAAFQPQLQDLRLQILKGNISTNDAATASQKWGISLDATKTIITNTQASLKQFVDDGLAGFAGSSDAVNSWSQDVQTAFSAVAAAQAKVPGTSTAGDASVAAAQARLTHAQTAAATASAAAQASAQRQLDVALARQADAVGKSSSQQASAAAAVQKAQAAIAAANTKGSSSVTSAQEAVQAAYAKSSKAAGANAADTLKAQQQLSAALDPENVVKKVQAQAQQIVDFQTNILKLVKQFPSAARALLSDPDKGAAAAFAAQLVNKPAIAAQFDQAQNVLQNKTRDLRDLLKGPLAQQFLTGGQVVGVNVTAGVAATTKIAPVVSAQTTAALASLAKQKEFAQAAGDLGAVATISMQQKMILANVAQSQVAGAAQAVSDGGTKVAEAAGKTAKIATGRYADGLDVKGKTTAAIAASADAWNGAITATTASSARAGGRVVGFQFGKGIIDGMRLIDPQVQAAATTLGNNVAAATRGAMKQSSPSKVGIEIGANFGNSIALGIASSARDSVVATNSLVAGVRHATDTLASTVATRAVTVPIALDVQQSTNAVAALAKLRSDVDLGAARGALIGKQFSGGVAAGVRSGPPIVFNLPTADQLRVKTDAALAGLRVVQAVLAKLRADVANATDPLAKAAVPQDLRNLQAAYATFNRTQLKPVTAAQDIAAATKANREALFTLASDLNKFRDDASKAPLLRADLLGVKASIDVLDAARKRARDEKLAIPVQKPIPVDLKLGRLPVVPPLELGVFLPRTIPSPVVHVQTDLTELQRAADELKKRFAGETLNFGVSADSLIRARAQLSELSDQLDEVRAHVPQLPNEAVTISVDSSAVAAAATQLQQLAQPITAPVDVDSSTVGAANDALAGLRANMAQVALDGQRLTVAPVVRVTADSSALLPVAAQLEQLALPITVPVDVSSTAPSIRVTADTSAVLEALQHVSDVATKPVVVEVHGDASKLVDDVRAKLGVVRALTATAVVAPSTIASAQVAAPAAAIAPAPVAAPAPSTKSETNVKVELHKVDVDPFDLANEISWRLG